MLKKLQSGHYSVIFGFNKTHFFLSDPSKKKNPRITERGFRTVKKTLFLKRWKYKVDTKRKILFLKRQKYKVHEGGNTIYRWLITVPLAQ